MTKFCEVAALLTEIGPMTTAEVASMLGVGNRHAASTIHKMHERKLIHIGKWELKVVPTSSTRPVAVYRLGPGRDAKKPAPVGAVEVQRQHRARMAALRTAPRWVFDLGGRL